MNHDSPVTTHLCQHYWFIPFPFIPFRTLQRASSEGIKSFFLGWHFTHYVSISVKGDLLCGNEDNQVELI